MCRVEQVKELIRRCEGIIAAHQEELTEVDSRAGDGDLGVSMLKGIRAVQEPAARYEGKDVGELLMRLGGAFNRAAPSTMGTLLGMGIASLGGLWRGKETLGPADLVAGARAFADAIARIGQARRGHKTILDALYPFADTLEAVFSKSHDFRLAYRSALVQARAGMEATKAMTAKAGRARWLGERALGTCDGGALLCVLVLEGLLDTKEEATP